MESSGELFPAENSTRHNGVSPLLDRSDEKQTHKETQQISGASAADESAIISADKGIGSIDNGRTNIKQAFLFFKGLKFTNSESGSASIVDKRSTISTRTASLDGYEISQRSIFPKVISSPELRLSGSSAGESSRALAATPYTRRDRLEWVKWNRTSCLTILGIVLLCVVTTTVVSALYVTHVLPENSVSSTPSKEVSSVSPSPLNDTVPAVSKSPSSVFVSTAPTNTSATFQSCSSSKSTTSGETTAAQPSTISSLPSSTVVLSSQTPSSSLTPAPTPIVTSFVTSTVAGALVSTCKWGCYGWDCTANFAIVSGNALMATA